MDTQSIVLLSMLMIFGFAVATESDECDEAPADKCDASIEGFFAHSHDCDKFIYCFREVLYTFKCSQGSWYNEKKGICDLPENVMCLACNAPLSPPTKPSCTHGIHFLPHESNCHKFYHCNNGIKVLKSCPSYLYFNPRINVCDWSYFNCFAD